MPKGVVKNPRFHEYLKDPKVRQWLDTLNKNTRVAYAWHLFVLCDALGVSGSELLAQHRKKPKQLYPQVIGFLSNSDKSVQTKNTIRAAFVNYLETFDEEMPRVIAKRLKKLLKKPKAVPHPLISWDEAIKIISLADPKYQPVYKLMLWGLDAERFVKVNNNPAIIKEVKEQLADPTKVFVRIPIGSRKTNPSAFYVMVPREIAAYLPVLDNAGQSVKSKFNIWHGWKMALKRAGYPIEAIRSRKHGPHNLRGTFDTESTKRGLPKELREFQLGHTIDTLNYQRIMQDDRWVTEQFVKAWGTSLIATHEEVESLQKQNEMLRQAVISSLEREQGELLQELRAVTNDSELSLREAESIAKELESFSEATEEDLHRLGAEYLRVTRQLAALGVNEQPQPAKPIKPVKPK